MAQWAEAIVLLNSKGPVIIQVVSDSPGGIVLEVTQASGVVGVDDRVVNEIPWMQVHADDRPDLGRDAPVFPVAGVDTELKIDSVEEFAVMCVGPDEQFPQLEAVDLRTVVRRVKAVNGEIKSLLKPGSHTVSPFGCSVDGVIGDDGSRKVSGCPPAGREVTVDHQIEYARRSDLRIVDLNLVGLRENHR